MIAKPFNDHFKFATDLTIIAKKVMLVKSAPEVHIVSIKEFLTVKKGRIESLFFTIVEHLWLYLPFSWSCMKGESLSLWIVLAQMCKLMLLCIYRRK